MTPTAFAVVVLASWRATVAVTEDRTGHRLRDWTVRRWPGTIGRPSLPVQLAACPRCLSFWTSGLAVLAAKTVGTAGTWPQCLLAWPAAAGGCWLLAGLL